MSAPTAAILAAVTLVLAAIAAAVVDVWVAYSRETGAGLRQAEVEAHNARDAAWLAGDPDPMPEGLTERVKDALRDGGWPS